MALDGAAEEADMEEAFLASTSSQPSPGDSGRAATAITPQSADDADSSDHSELGMEREALAFVAGYVAHKCQAIDPSLGRRTGEVKQGVVPDRWLLLVSRGGLTVPSPSWMAIVENFEVTFSLVMGATFDNAPGVVRRLCAALMMKEPMLDRRITRRLVTTRMHIRIRWLNAVKAAAAEKRRGCNQMRRHALSSL